MTRNEKEDKDFEDELQSIKEEMRELKEMLKAKAKEEAFEEEINVGGPEAPDPPNAPNPSSGFRIEFGDDDFEGVGSTLGDYLNEVMQGVAQNISNSMKQMTSGFQFENIKQEVDQAKREAQQEMKQAKREMKRVAKEMKHATKGGNRRVIRFQKLSDEELEKFYEKAPDLTSALSDEKKLQLLKALENEPMYQKDLSETTGIKGGTFKHHMDPLLEVQYIAQEAVRGRYFITQLGVEALKLSEMLFRRHTFVTEEEAQTRSTEPSDIDDDLETEIDEDITETDEAVDELQNEEDTG